KARKKSGNSDLTIDNLKQDEDVLDTWASSWLFPLEVFKGFDERSFENGKITSGKNKDLDYYYPTSTLVTAPEILFFWVARMIIAGYEYTGKKPFNDVYLTGIVRDKQRRKMSKSLGNSPDPLDLIAQYGADAVRTGMLFSSPAGNDLLYDEKLIEQGRNFGNKIWNAFRLVQGWEVDSSLSGRTNQVSVSWFEAKYNQTLTEVEGHFNKFRISDALMATYKLIWGDFCSWYLEMVKPEYQKPIDAETKEATIGFFEKVLKLLHPFMPFITEELYQAISKRKEGDCIIVAEWPRSEEYSKDILKEAEIAFEIISNIRNIRNAKQIAQKDTIELKVKTQYFDQFNDFANVIEKLGNLSSFEETRDKLENSSSFVLKGDEFFIPLAEAVDLDKEREAMEKELAYTKGFLTGVEKKLGNERFIKNAPEKVVAMEKKKMEDAKAKIKVLEESLARIT
ncbi:MAG: class I tRNA ligase family protein, partial [Bacteroidota bacterium]